MDHDESTYLIIGRDLALGKQLYVDVTDTKPIGIFLVYAAFYKLFGYSIFITRLAVAVLVGITSYLLFISSLKLFNEKKSAIAAALIYLFYTATWTKYGVAPNTELYFNLTTITGFYFLLKNRNWSFVLSGLLFGIGFMIKYLVIFDCVFLFAFFLIREFDTAGWKIKKPGILKYLLAVIAFSIPFLATNAYFYFTGNYDAFKYITYELPARYGQTHDLIKYFIFLLDFLGRFLPVSLMVFYVLFSKSGIIKRWQLIMFFSWIFGIIIAMYLPGKIFGHYLIQLMLPFSLIAGMTFHPEIKKGKLLTVITGKKYGYYFLLAIFLIIQFLGISGKLTDKDKPRQVAEYLKNKMDKNEWVYLTDYKHIVYYLLERDSPTKYVHPSLLTNPDHARAFGIDGKKEIKEIIEKQPDWIVMYDFNKFVKGNIEEKYKQDTAFFDGLVEVYKLADQNSK